jgi:Tfp pilus assembly protein PilW
MIPDTNLSICLQEFQVRYTWDTGHVGYSNVCLIPTQKKAARSWNIVQQVILSPTPESIYECVYDFTDVVVPSEYKISFDGPAQGIAMLSNRATSLNIEQIMTYTYDFQKRKLVLTFRLPCQLKRQTSAWIFVYISDCTGQCPPNQCCPVA